MEQLDRSKNALFEGQESLCEPPLYKVILYNDETTTQEFVVEILESVFNKSQEQSFALMMKIHSSGQAKVDIYPYDIANTKKQQTTERAREKNFPLRCSLERE